MSAAGPSDCYRKAIDLLARRPHFRRALERKLADRGFAADEIEAACARLERERLLDDLQCGQELAAGPWRRKGFGPRRMRAELERRGAGSEVIEAVLARSFAEGELEPALGAARRWRASHPADAAALARHLERKGFGAETIARVLRERAPSAAGAGSDSAQ